MQLPKGADGECRWPCPPSSPDLTQPMSIIFTHCGTVNLEVCLHAELAELRCPRHKPNQLAARRGDGAAVNDKPLTWSWEPRRNYDTKRWDRACRHTNPVESVSGSNASSYTRLLDGRTGRGTSNSFRHGQEAISLSKKPEIPKHKDPAGVCRGISRSLPTTLVIFTWASQPAANTGTRAS